MESRESYRRTAIVTLVATTAANAAFLVADPRLGHLELWLAAVFLIGGGAYVAAIPLCAAGRTEGFVLSAALGVLGGAVALADNLSLSGSTPNAPTSWLNVAVLALQVPLVTSSVLWLRGARVERRAPP